MIREIKNIFKNDPSAQGIQFILYPWLYALFFHKYMSHPLYRLKLRFFARLISQTVRFFTWIEIHPWAQLGKWIFIDHGMGIVIWETSIIGDDCILYHGVTLWWTWKHWWKRHPTVGNNVLIGANSLLIWPIIVWNNVQIWAWTVVVQGQIPENSTVVGNPWKIVRLNGERVELSLKKI